MVVTVSMRKCTSYITTFSITIARIVIIDSPGQLVLQKIPKKKVAEIPTKARA